MSLTSLAGKFQSQLTSGHTITLDNDSLSSSGANNIAIVLDLMGGHLDIPLQSLTITGLQPSDIPDNPGSELILSPSIGETWTCSFLNANQQQVNNLVFILDANNDLNFFLQTTLPIEWNISSIPNAGTFTALNGYLLGPMFIFSTKIWQISWPVDLSLTTGLNFYTKLDMKDTMSPLNILNQFLQSFIKGGTVNDAIYLFGTVDVINLVTTEVSDAPFPSIKLVAENITQSTDAFNLFFMTVKNPRISINTITFDDGEPSS